MYNIHYLRRTANNINKDSIKNFIKIFNIELDKKGIRQMAIKEKNPKKANMFKYAFFSVLFNIYKHRMLKKIILITVLMILLIKLLIIE